MPHYKYLVIGGGMTADAAIEAIRQTDPAAAVGMIGAEPSPPYNRPPLSKALWKGKPLESIWRGTERRGATLHLGRIARTLDVAGHRAVDDQGTEYTWNKVLLATGGTPRQLLFGEGDIIYFRSVADYTRLRHLTERGGRFAVIGSGFIGSEIAAALAMNKKEVVLLSPERGICERLLPRTLAASLVDVYRGHGVDVWSGEMVAGVTRQDGRYLVMTGSGRSVTVDGVVAGIGLMPNIDLARDAGLRVGNGILVDEQLRAGHPDVYAAGDVAEFYNPALATRIRVEHEDNANTMGRAAGRAMAGSPEPYHHLPFFYSDLFDLGYEAVGVLDARLETVEDWKEPNRTGVVYYLQSGRVRGVLLWNTWGQVDAARAVIADPGPVRAATLKGRLPAPA